MKIMIFVLALTGATMCQSRVKPLATVNGVSITEADVNQAAARQLEQLDLQKQQFEVEYSRNRHALIERTLNSLLEDQLLNAEAVKRGVTKEALIQSEIDARTSVPTDADVQSFYEINRSRLNVTGDPMPQIRQYLFQQKRAEVSAAFIAQLKTAHNVSLNLEPHRVNVSTVGFPVRGPETAPVTIVEFSDFECPFCANLFPTMKQIEKDYVGKVRIVYRQFPLSSIHPNAQKAAEASLCAHDQQKFWELHDAMFADIRNISVEALKIKAAELKMDVDAFGTCLDSGKYIDAVQADHNEGVRLGVTGTPALFVNGRFINEAQPYAVIAKIIDDELGRSAAIN
jgi:protein-disulfide isomerase